MGKSPKNEEETNITSADPMVRVEAFSTAGQAVALAQSLGLDAGCAVRGHGSRAAGTWMMTNWARERERTMGPRTRELPSYLGSFCAGIPFWVTLNLLQLSHQIKGKDIWGGGVILPELPTVPLYPSVFYYLLATFYLVLILNVLYTLLHLIFIEILRVCR